MPIKKSMLLDALCFARTATLNNLRVILGEIIDKTSFAKPILDYGVRYAVPGLNNHI